jgi:hypothetical protein
MRVKAPPTYQTTRPVSVFLPPRTSNMPTSHILQIYRHLIDRWTLIQTNGCIRQCGLRTVACSACLALFCLLCRRFWLLTVTSSYDVRYAKGKTKLHLATWQCRQGCSRVCANCKIAYPEIHGKVWWCPREVQRNDETQLNFTAIFTAGNRPIGSNSW